MFSASNVLITAAWRNVTTIMSQEALKRPWQGILIALFCSSSETKSRQGEELAL